MDKNKVIHLSDEQEFRFFVANCYDPNDIIVRATLKNIKQNKFIFGIILNAPTDHYFFENLKIPLFSVTSYHLYFCLDIITSCIDSKINKNKNLLRIIFVDLDKFVYENSNQNDNNVGSIDSIEAESNNSIEAESNNSIELDNLCKDIIFWKWFEQLINNSEQFNQLLIVTNKLPFHYFKFEPDNKFIIKFISILISSQSKLYYLTTDGDFFSTVTYGNQSTDEDSNTIKFIMIGSTNETYYYPTIFKTDTGRIHNGHYARNNVISQNGYVSISYCDQYHDQYYVRYISLNQNEVIMFAIHDSIRFINEAEEILEKLKCASKNKIMNKLEKMLNDEQYLTLIYNLILHNMEYINKNHCVHRYLMLVNNKKVRTMILRRNLIVGLVNHLMKILDEIDNYFIENADNNYL